MFYASTHVVAQRATNGKVRHVKLYSWKVSGTYYEVCNCEAVCPCRRHGEKEGGRSTYGICDFALSWHITEGQADDVDLSNLSAVLAGSYNDDEPGSPWRVIIYVDERGDTQQRQALADIFLGRAGGDTRRNFAAAIGEVYAVRAAKIELGAQPQSRTDGSEGISFSRNSSGKADGSTCILRYSRPRQTWPGNHR